MGWVASNEVKREDRKIWSKRKKEHTSLENRRLLIVVLFLERPKRRVAMVRR
jgi:hypothetical protein